MIKVIVKNYRQANVVQCFVKKSGKNLLNYYATTLKWVWTSCNVRFGGSFQVHMPLSPRLSVENSKDITTNGTITEHFFFRFLFVQAQCVFSTTTNWNVSPFYTDGTSRTWGELVSFAKAWHTDDTPPTHVCTTLSSRLTTCDVEEVVSVSLVLAFSG